jgi:hypothetical protein
MLFLGLWASRLPARAPDEAAPAPKVIVPPPEPSLLPAPAVGASADDADRPKKKKKKKGDSEARAEDDFDAGPAIAMTVGARLMMGFERESQRPAGAQTEPAQSEYGFTIRQIRLRLEGQIADHFRANVSFDLADALDPQAGTVYETPPYLRSATIQYRPAREFRIQVGRFKRPFSRLELTSASDLPILRRGLFNGLAIEDNQWGDRAIGVMAQGRLKDPKLRWYLSLTNPSWSTALPSEGVDVTVRVEWKVLDDLELGANATYKNIEIGNDRLDEFAYGGDIALKLGDANLLLEANSVALPFATGRPRGLGALFMVDYELELTAAWSLQPVLFAEYADANTDVFQNESLRMVFGLNVLGYDRFRVMPQAEVVRSIGDTSAENPWLESERLSLIFSLVL